MLRAYRTDGGQNERLGDFAAGDALLAACWIDLMVPTAAEIRRVEAAFGLQLPSREAMREIELSARVYRDGAHTFLTATVLCRADAPVPETMDLTFVLTGHTLITLRYDDPKPFYGFHHLVGRQAHPLGDGPQTLVALLEAIVARIADVLEATGRDLTHVANDLLVDGDGRTLGAEGQTALLRRIARAHDLTAKSRDSLLTLDRIVGVAAAMPDFGGGSGGSGSANVGVAGSGRALRPRLRTLAQDIRALADYTGFLSSNISFQLDALLGLVGIAQNNIVKIFSVAAAVFLPPTLVASLYGMNFHAMPELDWPLGYPLALLLMVLSAAIPFLWFRRRGWL